MTFIDNIKHSGDIFRQSWNYIVKDKSLLVPPILSAIFGGMCMIVGVIALALGEQGFFLYPVGMLFVLFAFFMNTMLAGALSWMVYEVHKGEDTTLARGLSRAFSKAGSLLAFAVVSFLVAMIAGSLRGNRDRQSPIAAILGGLLANFIDKGWDIVGSLVMPVIMIEQKTFRESFAEVEKFKGKITEVLVGGFAPDLIIGPLMIIITFFWFFFGFTFAAVFGPLGILFAIMGWIMVMFIMVLVTTTIKSIYFTELYIRVRKQKTTR